MMGGMDRTTATRVLELWETRKLDTAEIGQLLAVHESAVHRTIQASRDIIRQMYLEGVAPEVRAE